MSARTLEVHTTKPIGGVYRIPRFKLRLDLRIVSRRKVGNMSDRRDEAELSGEHQLNEGVQRRDTDWTGEWDARAQPSDTFPEGYPQGKR